MLGANRVGTYLHGSAVLGGFNPDRSDVDVLVVVRDGLTQHARQTLAGQVGDESLPSPAVGLELSVVTLAAAQRPIASPPYEIHVETAGHRVVEDPGTGDPDLVLHFVVCRAHGQLIGPGRAPDAVFAPVPESLVLRQLRAELEWARTAPGVSVGYLVLNAARSWCFVETGEVVSKVTGGGWALDRTDDREVIEVALARQASGGCDAGPDAEPGAGQEFAMAVVEKITTALEARRD